MLVFRRGAVLALPRADDPRAERNVCAKTTVVNDGFDFFSAWDDRFSDRSPPSRDLPPPRSFQRPPFHRRAIASDGGVVGASAAAAARAHAAYSR